MTWQFFHKGVGKAIVIAELTAHGRFPPGYTGLQHKVVGNNLWTLLQRPDKSITIALDILEPANAEYGWGHKHVTESMGPDELNCPLSFLQLATAPIAGYAVDWREKVVQYHAEKTAKPVPVESNQAPGQLALF